MIKIFAKNVFESLKTIGEVQFWFYPRSVTITSHFQADLFAVEMLNGYIYVHVDLGSGGVRVRASRRRVDDSHWHEFLLRRSGRDGRVTVDGANAEFKTPGKSE